MIIPSTTEIAASHEGFQCLLWDLVTGRLHNGQMGLHLGVIADQRGVSGYRSCVPNTDRYASLKNELLASWL